MKLTFIEEPELEFGAAGRHVDMRFGIMTYGPLDTAAPLAPKQIKVGLIGTAESVDGVRAWLDSCRNPIPGKPNRDDPSKPHRQPNLFAPFPGFRHDTAFHSSLTLPDDLCRTLPNLSIASITAPRHRNARIARAVAIFMDEIGYLAQNTAADVVICAVPLAVLQAIGPEELPDEPEEESDDNTGQVDFHDMLKATAMQQYRKVIQIILPSTYDTTKQRQQSRIRLAREIQDQATIAWNIHTALYYKAGGVPWRLPRPSTELTVCYVGVSFYRSLDQEALLTSVAQVFNERGEGVVVRGGQASISKDDRQPHLPSSHAYELLRNALDRYYEVHKTYPARVVVHKSSRFDEDERQGCIAALEERRIATHDFLSITDSNTRLFRSGQYPPLRGTLLVLDDREMVLYTRGSTPFFETYPGKYIPRPLRIRAERTEQTPQYLAREILALTKMNWNNTQFDASIPVTLRASRQCSSVLRYCSEARSIEPRYSYYM
jgi:hypothetical protein